jgi:hypothetical protein
MRWLAAACALALAASLAAESPSVWRAVDAATGQIADVAGLEQLARDFPDSASVRLRLFNAQLHAGDGEAALASLRWLAERGHVFGERARGQIPELIGAAHAEAARAALIAAPEVIAESTAFDDIPATAGLVEGIYVASKGERAMASSVSNRSVLLRGPGIDWLEIPIARASSLSGIASAHDDKIGWIASANITGAADDASRFTGLIGLTGNFYALEYIAAPPGVLVSDLAASSDGRVFASDPQGGAVTQGRRGAAELAFLVAPGTFRSPQGLAVSADAKRLYVSDYRYGLAMIDLATGKASRLASDVPVALDGVDGLWLHQGELVAIQNGTSPMRISAFRLSEDGTRITGHRILEQAHPDWTEPLGGSIADGALYYVATGQWDRYDKGRLREGMAAIPTVIRRLPLGPR